MNCLILGGGGQVGRALAATAPQGVTIAAPAHTACDITKASDLEYWIGEAKPALVINAAAWTDVNAAESHRQESFAVNAEAAGRVAALCQKAGARLIHISTDFVFDGAADAPYREDAAPHPLNAYGAGKYDGEQAVAREHPQSLIVRTAWLYADMGRNFVNTMLGLMAARDEIKIVADQTGTPTYARNLARALWRLQDQTGIYHFTDEGQTSWHGFATAIRDEALELGVLKRRPEIVPIAAADFPSPARRPAYSVLDNSKVRALIGPGQPWRAALREMLISRRAAV